ncbi:hypothetical protein [Mycobacterium tilburgii]
MWKSRYWSPSAHANEYARLFDQAGFRFDRVVESVSPLSIVAATAV